MNLATVLYLVDLINNLNDINSIIMVLYISSSVIILFAWCMTHDEYTKSVNAVFNKARIWILNKVWILVTAIILSIIIPSQKTMYLMLSSVYLSKTNLPAKVSEALELKLDDIIKDLKKGK